MNSRNHMKRQKICFICGEKFEDKYAKNKKHYKARDHCHYIGEYGGSALSIYNFIYLMKLP